MTAESRWLGAIFEPPPVGFELTAPVKLRSFTKKRTMSAPGLEPRTSRVQNQCFGTELLSSRPILKEIVIPNCTKYQFLLNCHCQGLLGEKRPFFSKKKLKPILFKNWSLNFVFFCVSYLFSTQGITPNSQISARISKGLELISDRVKKFGSGGLHSAVGRQSSSRAEIGFFRPFHVTCLCCYVVHQTKILK